MKKAIFAICVALLAFVPVTFAVDAEKGITKNGVSQGTLVAILKTHETLLNELAADHDADNATVAELVTDHDADNNILNSYETLIEELAADKDGDVTVLGAWETLLEELAADHDADNATVVELVTDHDADNDILDAHETLLEELGTDADANSTALGTWETLIEELAVDHDADNNVVADNTTAVNSLIDAYNESVVQDGNLAISATPEQFKTTQTAYVVLKGFSVTKTATDSLTFTAADTINTGAAAGDYWGAWKVELGLDGTVYTHSVGADQVYADEAAAIAALPATTANRVYIGYITVEANNGAAWIANTDDMTAASDCQDANFVDATEVSQLTAVSSAPAADLTATHPVASVAAALTASYTLATVAADLTANTIAADLSATHPVSSVATTLTATHPVSTVAADLTATTVSADLSADDVVGSGTEADPSISLTD